MNLNDFLQRSVKAYGPNLAIEMRPRYRTLRWTYDDLSSKVAALALELERQGVDPGDRVMLYGINSPHWIAGFFAILARGAVVVPLNPQSTPSQLEGIMASCEPKLLLKSRRIPWPAKPLPTLDIQNVTEAEIIADATRSFRPVAVEDDALAEIVYTSGTTGAPKGVMLSHANLVSNLNALSKAIPLKGTDHLVSIIPLFHMYGQMTSMLYPLKNGAAVTYLPSLSSKLILETFRHTQATHLSAVPDFLKAIMARLEEKLEKKGLHWLMRSEILAALPMPARRAIFAPIRNKISRTLKIISSGGAPLDPDLEKKWRLLGFELLQGYGLTETSPIIAMNTPREHRPGTVGKPLPGIRTKISAEGELLVRGPNVMGGYFRDEERTKAAFSDGWFKTDDGAVFDKHGFLSIFGRRKYMIVGGSGEKVFPEDIEEVLNRLPGVKDSAVVGVKKDGRTVIHAVLLGDEINLDQTVAVANEQLARHQRIMAASLWPDADFPRSATRKVKKEEIINWLKDQTAGTGAEPAEKGAATPLIRLLAQVTKRELKTIGERTRIVPDLHLDSLLRIELVGQIEEEFGVEIEEKSITQTTTVEELERMIVVQNGKPPVIAKYPLWSNRAFWRYVRPLIQSIMLFWWLKMWVPVRVEGEENLNGLNGPVIFMPNHRSYIDPAILLQALPAKIRRDLSIAAGVVVLYKKFKPFAWLTDLVFNSYPFPTEKDENIKPGLEYTGYLLDNGCHVMIFPEGEVLRSNQTMNHLKAGAGVMACEMQATVVPMAIVGVEKLMKPGQIIPRRRAPVTVRIGKPLHFNYTDSYSEATQKIETAMRDLIEG
ncbi:AMP-binding protein [Candidatus Uhrbacteria bacterium]|nr:AMP-binding protein [Candidatus Uhrbacteria bacterium]